MSEKRFFERETPPTDQEWKEFLWPLLRDVMEVLPDIQDVARAVRLVRSKLFWGVLIAAAGAAGAQRITATIEWLSAMVGGGS